MYLQKIIIFCIVVSTAFTVANMCPNLHLLITANFLSHSVIWSTLATTLLNLFQYQTLLKHLIHQFATYSMICPLEKMTIA